MMRKQSVLGALCLALAVGPVLAQTAPGAPGTSEAIPEKQAPPLPSTQPDSAVKANGDLSQKLDASGGVIKPPSDVDPGITKTPPPTNPASTPVIKPPGTPGGAPGPEAK